jgi:hypothetical protein
MPLVRCNRGGYQIRELDSRPPAADDVGQVGDARDAPDSMAAVFGVFSVAGTRGKRALSRSYE